MSIPDNLRAIADAGAARAAVVGGDDERVRIGASIAALRSQRDFFRAIDMPDAADHCEQAAISWEGSLNDLERRILLACAWSDYRKDYGVSAADMATAHKAFKAGWKAALEGDQSAALR